jgi:thiol:disulfide interchange protein DsbD
VKKLVLFLGALLLILSAQAGLLDRFTGSAEPQFLPVDQAFPVQTGVDGNSLIASWQSHPEYYLYKHRIFLTQGSVQREPVYLSLPGIEKEDEAFGLVTAFYGNLEARFDLSGLAAGEAILHYQGCADAGLCYPPQTRAVVLSADNVQSSNADAPSSSTASPAADNGFSGRSTLAVLGLFFVLGLGLTFTPCVLPMVPILTSVVLGQGTHSAKRGFYLSGLYVLGMSLAYAGAGVAIGLLGAGANIQAWLQTPWVLVLFALLFVLLALSMFGLYELRLPSSLSNRLNDLSNKQQGGKGISVFIMGALSALIVSPCISAPLAAVLMYISTTNDALLGGLALWVLALGMGTPLLILGTSGASLLPKTGAWMNQVKVFFGVLLLAVALWLVSRLLPSPLSLLLWALLAIVYALVLGALEPASSLAQRTVKGLAWVLLIYGALALAGVLMGNSDPLAPLAAAPAATSANQGEKTSSPFYISTEVADIEAQIRTSPSLVMLDLYAAWCISCKVMDKNIFQQADVQQALGRARWLKLDLTANQTQHRDFMQKHRVFGPPTLLFFKDGQEVLRIVGEVDKAQFLTKIQPLL